MNRCRETHAIRKGTLQRAGTEEMRRLAEAALADFDNVGIPGVPTWLVNGQRFWGKDRVDWLVHEVKRLLAIPST